MKLIQFVCLLLAVSAISAQASQLEVIKVLNYVRNDPTTVANWIKAKYLNQGTLGTSSDSNCYQEAYNFLMTAPKANLLSEDAGLDITAYNHAKNQVDNNLFAHNLNDGTNPTDHLKRFGRFTGSWKVAQMVAKFQRSTAVPANDVVMLLVSDCGVASRKHRSMIFSNTFAYAGVGVYNKERTTVFTLIFGQGFIRSPITNAQLDTALIEGNGNFAGQGASFETATFKKYGDYSHPAPEIHTLQNIEQYDDSTGVLGNLNNDGSVVCPTKINSDVLEIRTVKAWTKTSQKCTQGQGDFTTADNLDRKAPFAQGGKCYHRFRFCAPSGTVYTYDREYKTQEAVNAPPTSDIKNELGDGLDDVSVTCPTWVNSSLRVRVVNNWYLFSSTTRCTQGQDGFDASSGVKRVAPFAKAGRCYQRALYCSPQGYIWAKDSEYLTYSQWAATKAK